MFSRKFARGYIRVSTAEQASDDALSLETQEKMIRSRCVLKGVELIKCYVDAGISGKDIEHRPQLRSLVNEVQEGELVIVCNLARLSRNTIDGLHLLDKIKEKGGYLVSITEELDFSTPWGEMIYTVLMSYYKLERRNISINVSNNMKRISREGKLRSKPPFGWKFVTKDRDFVEVPEQQLVIHKILECYQRGMKMLQIANKLNTDGDNLTLNLNKKTVKEGTVPLFYAETIKHILINHGVIQSNEKRLVEKRIVSHHKSEESDQSQHCVPTPSIQINQVPSQVPNTTTYVQSPNIILEILPS